MCIFKYAYILFQILFPCFYKILSIVPCAIQRFASLMKTAEISLISMIDFILTWALQFSSGLEVKLGV